MISFALTRKTIPVILFFTLVICAVGRFLYIKVTVSGEGMHATSPDGMYYAEAHSYYGKKFFGGDRVWMEFAIQDEQTGVVVFSHTINGVSASIRETKADVLWSEDSQSLRFIIPDVEGVENEMGLDIKVYLTQGKFVID